MSQQGGRHLPDFLEILTPLDRDIRRIAAQLTLGSLCALLVGLGISYAYLLALSTAGVSLDGGPKLIRSSLFLGQISLGLAAMALGFLFVASRLFHRPMRAWITAAPRFRWSHFAWGLAVVGWGMAAIMALDAWLTGEPLQAPLLDATAGWGERAVYFAAALVGFTVAATAEEAVFRGYLLQQTAAFTRRLLLLLAINSLIFSAIHLEFDPEVVLARAVMGAAFTWAALRLGGLEFAIGAHLAMNLLIAVAGEAMLPETPPATGGLHELMVELALAAWIVAAAEFVRRRQA